MNLTNIEKGFKILTYVGSFGKVIEITATGKATHYNADVWQYEFTSVVDGTLYTYWLAGNSEQVIDGRMSYLEKVLAEGFWVSSESPKVTVSNKPGDYAFDIKFEFKDGKWTISGAG